CRRHLFLFFVKLSTSYGCGLPTYPPVLTRVVGGDDVREHSWPWQVKKKKKTLSLQILPIPSVLSFSPFAQTFLFYCCLVRILPHLNYISVSIRHSVCKSGPFFFSSNDIALIKLSTPVKLSNTIMPACLPPSGQVLPHDSPCYVTGWGRLWTGGPIADILQQALLPVVGHSTCSRPDWWGSLVTNSMVCAGGDGQLASCNGDSGGPLNCQTSDGSWDVVGVVSFGSSMGCNYPKKPSVFTRVSAYMSWINNVRATRHHILLVKPVKPEPLNH
uniref:pancreatic elastase II n=1 Tax=Sphaeramia orbicularis TaxID=375764 RepID=A0A673AIH0_9TELE